MMCFDMNFCDYAIKKGAKVIGAGRHHKTHRAYIFFDKNNSEFKEAWDCWYK